MAVPILVVTRNAGFGELICQILEETGKYSLALATNSADAASLTIKEKPALCILEPDVEGASARELVAGMRKEISSLLLILIPPDDDPEAVKFEDLKVDSTLSKPFYLPDLVTKVEAVIKDSGLENLSRVETGPLKRPVSKKQAASRVQLPPPPEWLQDVTQTAQYLVSLSIETSAQASLITKGDQIWAFAGELPQLAVDELARTVAAHFANGGGSDLARFILLEATGNEYMLYASGLGGDYILALVFDSEVPFSQIRTQTHRMADALTGTPPQADLEKEPVVEPFIKQPSPDIPVGVTDQIQEPFQALLSDVPPPIPADWTPETTVPDTPKGFLDELLEEEAPTDAGADLFSYDTVAMPRPDTDASKDTPDISLNIDQYTLEVPEVTEYQAETIASKIDRRPMAEDTAVSRRAKSEKVKLEPVSSSVYNLTYACVLIPRFPHHFLTGDIASWLADWVSHMCLAFGWRLEHLALRPEYLEWMVNVPPNTSPGYLIRTIRKHTSRRMFTEFPVLEEDNPSGDFWAPGYLIMSGNQPPPPQLVKDFIANTRKRQGLKK